MRKKFLKRVISIVCATALLVTGVLSFGGQALTVEAASYIPVYRLYNPNTGEHFYTSNEAEYYSLQNVGWNDEGIGWYGSNSGEAVYRLYNPNADGGDHYYTKSRGEAEVLVGLGWHIDNNWQPAFYSAGNTSLYVAYNPNAESGAHNYTTNGAEQNMLLSNGWIFGAVAWNVMAVGSSYTDKVPVDCNITGEGGKEEAIAGSYRWLYGDRTFDPADLSSETPEVDFSADVVLSGNNSDYAVQFALGGSSDKSGQVGITLHYQAGSDTRYAQGRINVTNINFPADTSAYGQQYYSVNTSAPRITNGQKVRLKVQYFTSGYMRTYVDGTLVGQYRTRLRPTKTSSLYPIPWDTSTHSNRYILHANADTSCTISNIQVLRRGQDLTNYCEDIYGLTDNRNGFHNASYDITNTYIDAIF